MIESIIFSNVILFKSFILKALQLVLVNFNLVGRAKIFMVKLDLVQDTSWFKLK